MKETVINLMLAMMPYMKPFMWTGVGIAVAGLLLLLAQYIFKTNTRRATKWTTVLVFVASVFFILAQVAGYLLNMTPAINFGDSANFEFVLVSFWQIGVGFLLVSIVLKFAGSAKRAQA
jgi:hypothetical protein